MKEKDMQTLLEMQKSGFLFKYDSQYVDSFGTIYLDGEEYFFESQVFLLPMKEAIRSKFSAYKPVEIKWNLN